MRTPSKPWVSRARAVLSLVLAASPAAAQTQAADAGAAPTVGAPTVSVSPAGGVGAAATLAPAMTTSLSGSAPIVSAPRAAVGATAASAATSASAAPATAAAFAPTAAPAHDSPVEPSAAAASAASAAATPTSPAGAAMLAPAGAPASAARRDAAAVPAPSAGRALTGAAGRVSAAGAITAAGGDELSVRDALARVYDAQAGTGATLNGPTAGRVQSVREKIAQEVDIANTASPADAPGLYQDAIKTAQDALPAEAAARVADVVRVYAARKADVSLGDLAAAAYQAAAGGSARETGRVLSAFDKWEDVLGAPGRPLVANAESLKSDVRGYLAPEAASAAPRSAPHVWFQRRGASYFAVLPSASRVSRLPAALAEGFALRADALAPISPLAEAYRAFAAAPGAASGAGVVYRARRALGASVPAAAVSAARYWLSVLLESLWRRLTALFSRAPAYDLSRRDDQDAVRRAAVLGRTARDEAAAARRRLAAGPRTIGDARAAFDAAARSAQAFDAVAHENVARSIATLRALFDASTAGLAASAAPTPAASVFVDGPGGLADWVTILDENAWRRALDVDRLAAPSGASFVNLGGERGPAVGAAALARELGADAAFVALDDQLWARGRGDSGDVSLSADLRTTDKGGSVALTAARGDAALARRLSDLGFAVTLDGAGLRAEFGAEDFGRSADEVGFLAARGLAAALGRAPAAAPPALTALSSAVRRDRAAAADLARLLDGRASFAGARVIGLVGPDEALAPVAASVGGKTVLVSALRDPSTGLLEFAVPLAPNGVPFGAAEVRSLLRAR